MAKLDRYEEDVLAAYEAGALKPVGDPDERARLKDAARATAVKDRRINIRLTSGDLHEIMARALQEGIPYQTLVSSVLHRYVTGQLRTAGADPLER
jgi:predicted DNA binding CopG/RHH family protein